MSTETAVAERVNSIAAFYNDARRVEIHQRRVNLEVPEIQLLHQLHDRLPGFDMLDIGVGAGRTSIFFAPFPKRYVGVDVAENMLKSCRMRFRMLGLRRDVEFRAADAADLKDFADASFDFVLFSFNGIDCIDLSRRDQVLITIKRVLKPNGLFVFSSHNLQMIGEYYRRKARWPPRAFLTEAARVKRIRQYNGDPEALLARNQAMFWDGVYHNQPDLRHVFVKPEHQVNELERLGFSEVHAISRVTGQTLTTENMRANREPWVYFSCVARKD